MYPSKLVAPLMMVGLVALVGCDREKPATTKSETTQNTPDGAKTTTQTETKQVGTTAESTTETKVDTPSGDAKAVTNTVVGTVTVFTPGKRIEVMTGNKDMHAYDLDGKSDVVIIPAGTTVGSKVMLVEEKGEKGFHKITVTPST